MRFILTNFNLNFQFGPNFKPHPEINFAIIIIVMIILIFPK